MNSSEIGIAEAEASVQEEEYAEEKKEEKDEDDGS